ncbi:hypothetical protein [Methylopila sp. 73B]|uniref:tetratricopeptide repeat protein n=1 Tax=Methylopila sp. 73B TaxID=1120792 RepID=UPI0012DE87C7|nr:hypothetical protein [Methylopila sp. 73B]
MSGVRLRAIAAALALGWTCAAADFARAATATVTAGMQPEGYARLVFAFDQMPKISASLSGTVLVVTFGEPTEVDLGTLGRDLRGLVRIVRKEADDTAIRFALERGVILNAQEAGDSFYVDLLPTTWKGMKPSLPPEVVAEMSRQARRSRIAELEAQVRKAAAATPLTVSGATHPTFRRLVFGVDSRVQVNLARKGDTALVTFGADMPFDFVAAKAMLPTPLAGLAVRRSNGGVTVVVPAPKDVAVRGFREDDTYVLDVDRKDAAPVADAGAGGDPHHAEPRPELAEATKGAVAAAASAIATEAHAPQRAPAPAPTSAPATQSVPGAETRAAPAAPAAAGRPELSRLGQSLRIRLPFDKPTPAAVFARGRTAWAVFDTPDAIPLDDVLKASNGAILAIEQSVVERGRVIRLKLAEPRAVTAAAEGAAWILSLGDDILGGADPIDFASNFGRDGRGALVAHIEGLGGVREIDDPEFGDRLMVASLSGPARASLRPQAFVEVGLLLTAQGVVALPMADDVRMTAKMDALTIERDAGLSLSIDGGPRAAEAGAGGPASDVVLDAAGGREAVSERFYARERKLLDAAARATPDERIEARVALARFYAFRRMAANARAVIEATVGDDGLAERDPRVAILRAAAAAQLGRYTTAIQLLSTPQLAANPEASLWRAFAEAGEGRVGPARDYLSKGKSAIGALPPDYQALFSEMEVSLALEAKDHVAAVSAFDRLELLPAIHGQNAREVIRARVFEALGQTDKALQSYDVVLKGSDPISAAEADLRAIELRLTVGKISIPDAIAALERLVTGWRGDWIEAEGLARLSGLYADAERWRDAFTTLKTSVEAFPDVDATRTLQDRMQARFTDLFLGPAVDRMQKVDALALFYDFQELSPGGKRGDELVRRLADKLVEVDLLDQASALLEYQIENRLTGAGRAQVAARAAMIYLMNDKPAEAARVLQKTRQADLPASLVRTRLMLDARALAQTGRTELALEMADGLGPEAARLKADVLWAARRWSEAGDALEVALGPVWRKPEPLDASERADVMRAAISLSLADDDLGLDRIRQKFASKMADSPDAHAFEVVTAPIEARGEAFREVARSIATTAAFEGFLKDYRKQTDDEAASNATPPRAEGAG